MYKLHVLGWSRMWVLTKFTDKSLFTSQKVCFSEAISKSKNLYSVLGVSEKATQAEIKDSYYDLTLKFHPDRNQGSSEAAIKFREITEAYEILGNYFLRKRYDRGLPMPSRPDSAVTPPSVEVHAVKYQKFFDSRNLPYRMSAYAAGAPAKKKEYRFKKLAEPKTQLEEIERVLDDPEEVRHRQNCLLVSIFIISVIHLIARRAMGFTRPDYPLGLNIEDDT